MSKWSKERLRYWWIDVKWNSKHGTYDWLIPFLVALVGGSLWVLIDSLR